MRSNTHTRERTQINDDALQRTANFLAEERTRLGKTPLSPPVRVPKSHDLSTQNDGTSCGAFVFAYAYLILVHGAVPDKNMFDGDNHMALRLVMLDFILRGAATKGESP